MNKSIFYSFNIFVATLTILYLIKVPNASHKTLQQTLILIVSIMLVGNAFLMSHPSYFGNCNNAETFDAETDSNSANIIISYKDINNGSQKCNEGKGQIRPRYTTIKEGETVKWINKCDDVAEISIRGLYSDTGQVAIYVAPGESTQLVFRNPLLYPFKVIVGGWGGPIMCGSVNVLNENGESSDKDPAATINQKQRYHSYYDSDEQAGMLKENNRDCLDEVPWL